MKFWAIGYQMAIDFGFLPNDVVMFVNQNDRLRHHLYLLFIVSGKDIAILQFISSA